MLGKRDIHGRAGSLDLLEHGSHDFIGERKRGLRPSFSTRRLGAGPHTNRGMLAASCKLRRVGWQQRERVRQSADHGDRNNVVLVEEDTAGSRGHARLLNGSIALGATTTDEAVLIDINMLG